jgi:hypothetical protein
MTEHHVPELEDVRQAAREVIEKGCEVREHIRDITLNALKTGQLEAGRIKNVVETVGEGALSGLASDAADSKHTLREACAGQWNGRGQTDWLNHFRGGRRAKTKGRNRHQSSSEHSLFYQ